MGHYATSQLHTWKICKIRPKCPYFKVHWLLQLLISILHKIGEARIRVQLSAVHSTEDVNRCIDAFIDIGRAKGVISWNLSLDEGDSPLNYIIIKLYYATCSWDDHWIIYICFVFKCSAMVLQSWHCMYIMYLLGVVRWRGDLGNSKGRGQEGEGWESTSVGGLNVVYASGRPVMDLSDVLIIILILCSLINELGNIKWIVVGFIFV